MRTRCFTCFAVASDTNDEIDIKFRIVSLKEWPEKRIIFLHVCPSGRMQVKRSTCKVFATHAMKIIEEKDI
jgi:hypothetical protein